MNELLNCSARLLLEKIRKGEASSEDVVRAHLGRIADVNPALNAVVELRAEDALKEARQADGKFACGESVGPLHGLPVTIKEAIAVEGMIWSGGTKGRASVRAERNATAVKRMRDAGAIVLGTTNLPEMSFAYESDNLLYGRSNNPYDLSRTPGGSTGGEAAIIAACGSPLGLGGDYLGSIRVPAHFCGIAGLRPTPSRVPGDGYYPAGGILPPILAQAGPLARSVDDLGLALSVIAGPDGHDPLVPPVPLLDPNDVDVTKLRIAWYTDNGIALPDLATKHAVKAAATALEACGAMVIEDRPDGIEQSLELLFELMGADGGEGIRFLLEMAGTAEVHPPLETMLCQLRPFAKSVAQWQGTWTHWNAWRRSIFAFMERYDAILSPVCAQPAMPHGTTGQNFAEFSFVHTHSLAAAPAVVVRAGTADDGLPIGVQVVPRCWREDVGLAVARQIETALGGWRSPTLEISREVVAAKN